MRIAIYRNPSKPQAHGVYTTLCSLLGEAGISWYDLQDSLHPDTDLIAVIGGDGTVLRVVPQALAASVPVWPLNVGGMGFLAESCEGLPDKVARLLGGDYRIEKRDTLLVQYESQRYYALNDVVIERLTHRLQTVTIHLSFGSEHLSFRGDGAVLCTASGSTGYSLSAGGPIVSPDVRCITFAPLCAHDMHTRHVVFGADTVLRMWCDEVGALFVDGILLAQGEPGVTVSLSDKQVSFLRLEQQGFFGKIAEKLY